MLRLTNGQHRLHFCVQTKSHRTPPDIRYEWQNGCLFGISLSRRDAGKAETWIAEAIAAGYQPLASFRKRGSAYCPNEISALLQVGPPSLGRVLIKIAYSHVRSWTG
jgi:hypothetical protein